MNGFLINHRLNYRLINIYIYIDDDGYKCLDIKMNVYETIYEERIGVHVVRERHLNGSEVPDNEQDLIEYLDWLYETASKEYNIKARHKR